MSLQHGLSSDALCFASCTLCLSCGACSMQLGFGTAVAMAAGLDVLLRAWQLQDVCCLCGCDTIGCFVLEAGSGAHVPLSSTSNTVAQSVCSSGVLCMQTPVLCMQVSDCRAVL